MTLILTPNAAAQVGIPGNGGGSAPAHIAKYYGYMLGKVFEITDEFAEAWESGDRETLEEMYHPEARLMVDEAFPIRGPEAIYDRLTEMFPQRWNIRLTLVDFEADGYLAIVYGELGDAPGKHVTVIMRKGSDWGIIRQFLIGAAPESDEVAGSS